MLRLKYMLPYLILIVTMIEWFLHKNTKLKQGNTTGNTLILSVGWIHVFHTLLRSLFLVKVKVSLWSCFNIAMVNNSILNGRYVRAVVPVVHGSVYMFVGFY